jgi:Tfp pilus assembly protein PilP
MKLIQILALATAMATMATAQNSSATGQNGGTAKPNPTATPAATIKSGAGTKAPVKTVSAIPAGKNAGATAKPANGQASSAKPAGASGAAPAASPKPAVKTGSVAAKKNSGAEAQSSAPAGKSKSAPTPATPAKGGAAAKTGGQPPAVIAVKPKQGAATKGGGGKLVKKGSASPTRKTPAANAPAPKVTQVAQPATAKPADKPKPVARSFGARGRRDPFVSPIRVGGMNVPAPNCTSGKRCLAIPELVLQGTVKDMTGKMMAVVANSTKKTYFLRENDQVFNGSVEKITSDSIIFREYVKDQMGRDTAREVVKKLVPTS